MEQDEAFAIVIQSNNDLIPDVENPDTWADYVVVYFKSQEGELAQSIDKEEVVNEKIDRAKSGIYRIESMASFLLNKYGHLYLIPRGKSVVFDDDITK